MSDLYAKFRKDVIDIVRELHPDLWQAQNQGRVDCEGCLHAWKAYGDLMRGVGGQVGWGAALFM